MKSFACTLLVLAAMASSAHQATGQTFQATRAIDETKCRRYLFWDKCVTVETDRLHWTFTRAKLGLYVFGRTWATASHCTHVDATETKCLRSISISTDPEWNRVLLGQAGTFLRLLGKGGTPADGPYHFLGPLGVDITRREGEWHVGFVADSRNNRIAVIAFGYTCKCVRWLGTLDGSESGKPLKVPHDVTWDPADTWTFADDRLFIADTYNDRVVVYQVSVDPDAGTMNKTYLSAFGTTGSGPAQLSRPQGIRVRSRVGRWLGQPITWTDVYISDTDNRRVSIWQYDASNSSTPGSASAAAQTSSIVGSQFVGITHDYYGDLVVVDRARNMLVKFGSYKGGPFTTLKTYGGTSSWSTGNFNQPTDAEVIHHYWQDGSGGLVQETLPYVQTVEQWTATTGGQLHHLGVDAEELAVIPGQCDATFTFLLTAYGDYNLKVKNSGGGVVASWSRVGVSSGRKSEFWNAQGHSAGTYSYLVEHRSAYGDETTWRTSTGPSFNLNCFTVTATVPSGINQGGTYPIYGSSSHPADSWSWQKSYSFFTTDQNSSFYVPHDVGTYTIDWQLTARRITDGAWDSDYQSTYVSIAPDPPPCDVPVCEPMSPPVQRDTTTAPRRIALPQGMLPRRNYHVGSGAWIGRRGRSGPVVQQFYSFTGRHQARAPVWPNVIGEVESRLEPRNAAETGRVIFTRRTIDPGDAYRARFLFNTPQSSGLFVGLAFDPELGVRPGDDSLGFDPETGLIWLADPDSGAIGYFLTDVPSGARVALRQFSTRNDAWRPDPVGDSAAYAEISASGHAFTGKPGDVRLLIAIGPFPSGAKNIDVGFVLLSAPSLTALRERFTTAPRSVLSLFADDTTLAGAAAIKRFRLTQAPPDPMAPEGVVAISPALVPGLSSDSTQVVGGDRAALRDAVRRFGITALAFAVPDGSQAPVKIRLYDPAGRLVRTLVNDTYSSGTYRVQWDLKDQRGNRAAPGVYIAIMEAAGFRGTTRLVVVP